MQENTSVRRGQRNWFLRYTWKVGGVTSQIFLLANMYIIFLSGL